MLDSGFNCLILKMSDDIPPFILDYTSRGGTTGTSATSIFNTDGTGNIGMCFDYTDNEGKEGKYYIATPATFASEWNFDLLPTAWWQRLGNSALFDSRQSLTDHSGGTTTVTIHELNKQGRSVKGTM
jgi:hypothetical protein